MRLLNNTGADRVVDELRRGLVAGGTLDIASPAWSLYAYADLRELLAKIAGCRLVLPADAIDSLGLVGGESDRVFRNRLQQRWLAKQCAEWIARKADVRSVPQAIQQSLFAMHAQPDSPPASVIAGSTAFTTDGLGITPSDRFGLIQLADGSEGEMLGEWFANLWNSLASNDGKRHLLEQLADLWSPNAPSLIYHLTLYHLLASLGGELDEEKIVKSATGIRETVVWQKLFRFQRDAVVGAIDKLERFGGCVLADSVGLGKTFEALAIIKYHELRNDRVLVLVPKRLRDNWTLYKANDRRNFLAPDRFNYDVLNHTDLSRDSGSSGDIDLSYVNWGNYDLVVIDESHNFRNKKTPRQDGETRYDRLMRRIIQEGVKTRVLMLSATPVNNRLADLKNQIAFVTEGKDRALAQHGISSIESTVRLAQTSFNRWLALKDTDRTPARLVGMLGFDYFQLLDLLTIARSRKHIQKYYGTQETGEFPERLKPINRKPDVDLSGEFPAIRDINNEIRRLHLSAYAPLRYILPHKQAAYDAKYSQRVKGGTGLFRQLDREESLIHLLRVNVLKRMESSVHSFALTVGRQLADVEDTLKKISDRTGEVEEIDIDEFDLEDPAVESLVVGRAVKVLLQDVDLVRWQQDLSEDRDRLRKLLGSANKVSAARDAKLSELRKTILQKWRSPVNDGNRKVIVFTAFADTARYLFGHLAPWAEGEVGVHSALVTGTGSNQTTLPTLRRELASILTAFAPQAKERPPELASEGDLDLLIATDCISEGQNLQDCDMVINYDIHWNPVRIIQRFGRIDRIGSPNDRIQLVNFWPNIELEEYINLEQRVSGRMVLLDVSATGEENLIEYQSGNQMNDLEYRRNQLLKLQDAVIDIEDLASGVSITDLTLNDFRIDLSNFLKERPGVLERVPLGALAVTTGASEEPPIASGIIFCLRAFGERPPHGTDGGYPLFPHYLVHVGDDAAVLLGHSQVRQALDVLKRLCLERSDPDTGAGARFNRMTRDGRDMAKAQALLAKAVASIAGREEERSVASLFKAGGTHARREEFGGIDDFEVVAFLVVLPEEAHQ